MEWGKLREVVIIEIVILGLLIGQSSASFKDCYAKCFIFCAIEPSQTLCSCATQCLKDCIFNPTNSPQDKDIDHANQNQDNFCKLGCASSLCFHLSTKHNPNEENMEKCMGTCSEKCTKNYSPP